MILETISGKFTVHFWHSEGFGTNGHGRQTSCGLHYFDGGKCDNPCDALDLQRGVSYCAPTDMFDRNRGRKIALSRAIKSLSRQLRAEIWQAYFKTIGHF